jgi:hypothetical protein
MHISGTSPAMMATGSVMVSGSIRGNELYFIHGACDLDQSALRWLPMGYGLAESAAANYTTRFVCPAKGRIVRTIIRCKAAAGSTNLTLYKASDGTSAAATYVERTNTNIAATDTTYSFNMSGNHHFNAGEVISFSLNPSSNPDETNFTHVLEFYTYLNIPTSSF